MPRIYSFDDFIEYLYGKDDSIFTCVSGPKASGKTEFNLLQMERIHDLGLGFWFGSNMPIPDALRPNFEMTFIEDFETLEKTCRMINPDPTKHGLKKCFFFLSELAKFVPRDQAWKKENIGFIEKLQTVRKYGLSMLTDAVDRVDGRVLSPRFFHGEFIKPFSENPKYAIYKDFRTGREFTFKDIPKCEMWFDSYYSANFYLESQGSEANGIFLNEDHQRVKKYMEHGSWAKTGIHRQTGKDSLMKVLKYHFSHCLNEIQEESIPSIPE